MPIVGTAATGRFGPDLTHLMSRRRSRPALPKHAGEPAGLDQGPDSIKPGSLMPAMNLSDDELDAVTAYMLTLR